MSVEIVIRETKIGLEIVSGRRRLDALLALRDEVVVMSPGIGEIVIARLPDGRLQGSANPKHINLFRQPEAASDLQNQSRIPLPPSERTGLSRQGHADEIGQNEWIAYISKP